jgi:hypothetical protein
MEGIVREQAEDDRIWSNLVTKNCRTTASHGQSNNAENNDAERARRTRLNSGASIQTIYADVVQDSAIVGTLGDETDGTKSSPDAGERHRRPAGVIVRKRLGERASVGEGGN